MIWTHRTVFDPFEEKVYGDYHWHTDPVKKYWEVPPFQCKVVLLIGDDHICKSDDEFKDLIKTYMGK